MSGPNNPKPWLDKKGKPPSTAQLKQVSKAWDTETWEEYLQSLEHGREEGLSPNFEELLQKHDRKEALEKYYEELNPDGCTSIEMTTVDSNVISKALSQLTHLEREVLMQYYWEGRTEQQIADNLEHARGKIRRCYLRALKKMKEMLIQDPDFQIKE